MSDDLLLPDALLGLDEWLRGCCSPLTSINDSLAFPAVFSPLSEAPGTPGTSIESVGSLEEAGGGNGGNEGESRASVKRKRCKSTIQRQKEEKAALRLQAAELKARIDCMAPPQPLLDQSKEKNESIWGALAKRQEEQKEKAEAENAKLREEIAANKKFVRSLARLLRKAEEWNRIVSNNAFRPMTVSPALEDRDIFVRLASNVDAIGFPRISGPCDFSNDVDAVGTIRTDASGACIFEQEETRLMPFDLDLVNKVSWLSVGNGTLHFGVRAIATITQSEDTLASQLSVDPMSFEGDGDLELPRVKTYLVLKRQRNDDRIAYAWEALSFLPEVKKLGTPALTWIQRGWNESAPHKLRSGGNGCTIRSFTRAFIGDLSGPQVDTDQGQLKLMQILADSYDKSRVKVYQSLENLMLDEVVRSKKRRRLL